MQSSSRLRRLHEREAGMSRERRESLVSTPAYFCARNNFDPPVICLSKLTISKVHSHICSETQQIGAATPPCGRSSPPGRSVVDGWRRDERTRDIPQSLLRALVSSAKPTTGIQVERPAAPSTASTRSLQMPTEQGLSTPSDTGSLRALRQECCARMM